MSAVKVWDSLSKAGEELVQTTGKSAAALVRHRCVFDFAAICLTSFLRLSFSSSQCIGPL